MKRRIVPALLLAGILLLTGCSSFLHREYSEVEPHSSSYYESENVLRAENRQDLVNDLLLLISQRAESGTVWFYDSTGAADAASLVELACREVQTETPLGAYAVEYITYTLDATPRNYTAVALTIGYCRTEKQMDAIVHTTGVSALPNLLTAAAAGGAAELTVQLSYFDEQQQEVRAIVADVQARQQPQPQEAWEVNFYPESGDVGIIEIILKK